MKVLSLRLICELVSSAKIDPKFKDWVWRGYECSFDMNAFV